MSRAAAVGIGILSLAVTAALIVGVLALIKVSSMASKASVSAQTQCERSVVLGPKLADYYARDPAFPRDVLAVYRETIPKSCPSGK